MGRKRWKRRDILKALAVAAGGLLLGQPWRRRGPTVPSLAQGLNLTPRAYLPLVMKGGGSPSSGVVHVRAPGATYWDFGNNYYGNYVDQSAVDQMVDRGVMELTGTSSVAAAWQAIVPGYTPGKGIAIKVNFNNCFYCDMCREGCDEWQMIIDALVHPVNGIIRGLRTAYPNFENSDIWIYDATIGRDPSNSHRQIPKRFKEGLRPEYAGVRFFDQGCNEIAGYTSNDPTAAVVWHNPSGVPTPPTVQVTDVLVNATYVINIPIMKRHLGTGVTLSFKNHFGSIANPHPLHDWVYSGSSHYSKDYSPLVDIYRNPNILDKTVLTVGDGLFGNWEGNERKSKRWITFGNSAPDSLFFSTDPVAIDCVMADFLEAEDEAQGIAFLDMSRDYLVYAASLGLGVYEQGDPWGSGYSQIEYRYIEL